MVRHGQTEWNQQYRFQGRTDVPLNDEGREQAERLAGRLASWPVEVVYSSPLERAVTTAWAVAKPHGLVPVMLEELVEVRFGAWEGRSILREMAGERDAFRAWKRDPFFNMPPGAEDWESIRDRTAKAVETILGGPQERIVVVSHGGVMRALYAVLVGFDPHQVWNMDVTNCAMTGVELRNGRACIRFANDDLHVRGGRAGRTLPVWDEAGSLV